MTIKQQTEAEYEAELAQKALSHAITLAFDTGVRDMTPIAGGDINEAFAVTLTSGTQCFVKTQENAPRDLFPTEAKGLRWLAESGSLRVPEVLAVSDYDDDDGPPFLALEFVKVGPRRPKYEELLGHGLAALHRSGAPTFGLEYDNYIARFPQVNTPCEKWPEFYVLRRLEPQLKRAVDGHNASSTMKSFFKKLFARMEFRVGDPEPPARLHGDLWSGNVHTDEAGEPCFIDPAVYGGHREMDLAMLGLFGGFTERVWKTYNEVFPHAEGIEERVPLYQLYPLLVHVNLFGHGYVDQVERALRKVV